MAARWLVASVPAARARLLAPPPGSGTARGLVPAPSAEDLATLVAGHLGLVTACHGTACSRVKRMCATTTWVHARHAVLSKTERAGRRTLALKSLVTRREQNGQKSLRKHKERKDEQSLSTREDEELLAADTGCGFIP